MCARFEMLAVATQISPDLTNQLHKKKCTWGKKRRWKRNIFVCSKTTNVDNEEC